MPLNYPVWVSHSRGMHSRVPFDSETTKFIERNKRKKSNEKRAGSYLGDPGLQRSLRLRRTSISAAVYTRSMTMCVCVGSMYPKINLFVDQIRPVRSRRERFFAQTLSPAYNTVGYSVLCPQKCSNVTPRCQYLIYPKPKHFQDSHPDKDLYHCLHSQTKILPSFYPGMRQRSILLFPFISRRSEHPTDYPTVH